MIERERILSSDGAAKFLIGLEDGQTIETLYMHDSEQRLTFNSTVCVSSQVGCAVGCRFCATGEQGFFRNLTAQEIVGQVLLCDSYRKSAAQNPIDAVVFAGMGEPLLNFDQVSEALAQLSQHHGFRSFELASVGVVPKIKALAEVVQALDIRLRLNISLHATTDAQRARLIPMTERYGIEDILDAASCFATATDTTVRIRYMLLKDVNTTDSDMRRLIGLLKDRPFKLIISSYNDNTINGLLAPTPLDVLNFYNKIKTDLDCGIFRSFGGEVLGGCGQLRQARKIVS